MIFFLNLTENIVKLQMESFRLKGLHILKTQFPNTDIVGIERDIFEFSMEKKNMPVYFSCIHQIIENNSVEFTTVNDLYFGHKSFGEIEMTQLEQDDFLVNPFELTEGVLVCTCGNRRVFSYSKQTRGSDEPMTTFAQCSKCNKKWTC